MRDAPSLLDLAPAGLANWFRATAARLLGRPDERWQAKVTGYFLAEGVRLPLRICESAPWMIVDADGDPIAMALPNASPLTRVRRAALLTALSNVAAGVSAPTDPQRIAAE